MIYKSYIAALLLWVLLLLAGLTGLAWGIVNANIYFILGGGGFTLFVLFNLYRYLTRRFVAMDDFFEAVKYRDFSRWFSEKHGPQDIRRLHQGFNNVNKTIKNINNERQAQFVYLQKILEMVDVGIIAYNLDSGEVLWANESLLNTLDLPNFKNIGFVEKRRPQLYDELFDTYRNEAVSTEITLRHENLKVLISETVFQVEEDAFKLVVLQNIENTLNQTESDAWKKLLSVMTHEIMNSIAPISSLAETLQNHIQNNQQNAELHPLELDDLNAGISSIQKRSEGLMKFAKTYRSLSKVTHLNLETVKVGELFKSISDLMQPSLADKNVSLHFKTENPEMLFEIDSYLIEQVLINLILNAIDATQQVKNAKIVVTASQNSKGKVQIKVRDNGSGIPEEIRESIFIPFFSTKKTGSGIGLSLSKQIMTLHKGKIQLQSDADNGTEFTLQF
ncbi:MULTISPECIES: HAMP domain-containing sensor histidine kinase [unclassified Leeuwenhoekiella]|uniref:sensor histidine kinase n=1 Tax=unclassified Leeuwenhoekiella TaxID=2615029 RepID=UPI000C3BC4C9|nr:MULTISPECIES: HAMP domain-containing sensor histidine kinase [unclassified Leeuwenhoekiella]MAW96913.1 ATP-binding protein [Leeuwenhoekiella sp.]MBA80617.1 ATP-binding protein [Leeuwenhoekiella sp.]|tara:strand:+ start:20578 stop:21921 length:1344 start_codon:yes stop_codon:yes gene_type:complete